MKHNEKKYAIIYTLENNVYQQVRSAQEQLSEITGARKCLEAWEPHITLGSGILLDENQLIEVTEKFNAIAQQHDPITLKITDVGGTTTWKGADENNSPYVIWLNVERTPELVSLFEDIKEITDMYEAYLPRITTENYQPHITLAYSDLSKEGHDIGSSHLNNADLPKNFIVSHIGIVESSETKNVEKIRISL